MVEEAETIELARQVVEATLECSAEQLAGEEDLGPLILLLQREANEDSSAAYASGRRRCFLCQLVFAHRWTAYRGTNPDGSTGKVLHLNWPGLLEVIDLEHLRRRIEEIDSTWVEAEFDEDTVVIWDQARYFVDNPAAGDEAASRWPRI